jgi:hypothetical protein
MNRTTRHRLELFAALVLLAAGVAARADPAPFDLAGPSLEVTVSRGMVTLPISEVPNLAPGDQLWIKAELPVTQSAQYLMVAAFLTGSTNPPPPSWFFRCETWSRQCTQEGLTVTVPQGAQQVLVFLAPKTSGDFSTLVDAVRGRPGAFVRASQDLNQAALDRSRLQAYLAAIHDLDESGQARLKDVAPLLARSLAIKVNDKCLDRIPELQAPCLMQGEESLIMNDGHSTSIVEALTSGPASDLAMEASFTPQLSYGYYSPYIASVFDIAHILGSFHTAQYQYIPALASLKGEQLALTLNAPPSFQNPKSVMVVALPAVEDAQLPPLHAVDPKEIYCSRKSSLILPVEGAPLVFSTAYTHDVTLSLVGKNGEAIDLPARADAQQGGFVVDTSRLGASSFGDSVRGSVHGYWGFDAYDGPSFQLVNAHAQTWQLTGGDEASLIVGRQDTIHLRAETVACVDNVMLRDAAGKDLKAEWKTVKADEVELKLPLEATQPGSLTLLVKQYGDNQPQPIQLQAYSEAGHLDGFSIHLGDAQGVLKGSRLDEVASLSMKGIEFVPGALSTHQGSDELPMVAKDSQATAALKQTEPVKAKVTLNDGRMLTVMASVGPPRPSVTLIDKSVQPALSSSESNIQIADPNELPQHAKLTFSVRAHSPPAFVNEETIEVATTDGSSSTTLSLGNGGITLASASVAVATLDPAKVYGMSAFGPLQFRVIVNGTRGDWQPLATLVRLPELKDLQCPSTPALACKLCGSDLYLVDSVSSDPQFDHPVQIPEGFPGYALPVPRPTDGRLYIKLRDNPSVVNSVALAAAQLPPSPQETAREDARLAAAPAANLPTANSDDTQPSTAGPPQISPAPPTPPAQSAPAQPQEIAPASGPQDAAPSTPISTNVPQLAHTS